MTEENTEPLTQAQFQALEDEASESVRLAASRVRVSMDNLKRTAKDLERAQAEWAAGMPRVNPSSLSKAVAQNELKLRQERYDAGLDPLRRGGDTPVNPASHLDATRMYSRGGSADVGHGNIASRGSQAFGRGLVRGGTYRKPE